MTWTTMHIGGPIPASKIDDLLATIEDDFSEMAIGPDDENQVRDVANKNESLILQGQVNCGNPATVIDFCVENDLPFWLHFDAGYEWDSGIQIWKPGTHVEECSASAQGYEPTLNLKELRGRESSGEYLREVIDDLARFESDKVPPLTIKDGDGQGCCASCRAKGLAWDQPTETGYCYQCGAPLFDKPKEPDVQAAAEKARSLGVMLSGESIALVNEAANIVRNAAEIARLQKLNGKMLSTLDGIHAKMEAETLFKDRSAEWQTDLFNEIGCLIAEAKGEYVPETN
ncbi:hypothetical protein [Bradyrhizobium erythrophlei]|nr:hypothetical protein [Bradyrhizobium erythrophlei]